jgi:hypothetical protein
VLDDMSVIRQLDDNLADQPLHVFTPGATAMVRGGGRARTAEGKNPPRGVTLSYYISSEQEGPLEIEILDASGKVVRRYSSEEGDFERCIISNMDQRIPFEVKYPKTDQGLNQWSWDMRRDGLNCIGNVKLFAGFGGASVTPGKYQALVTLGDFYSTTEFTLDPDPRSDATPADYADLAERLDEVTGLLNELLDSLASVRKSRSQTELLMQEYPDAEGLQAAGASAIEQLTAWENTVTQTQYGTYEDEDSMPPMLDVHIRHLLDVIDQASAPVSAGSLQRLTDLRDQWAERQESLLQIAEGDIVTVNIWARENGVSYVQSPGQ